MAFLRPLIFAAALSSMSLLACGSSGGGATPEGTHYHYVASRILVPTQPGDARAYGLDLNNDGLPDNALGNLLAALSSQGINAQIDIDEAVFGGSITLLADVQTTDFTNAGAAGVQVYLGANPQPPACASGEMVTCGSGSTATCTGCQHDLTGTGMFSIDPSSPMNAALEGPIVGGTFKGGPGDLSLQISLSTGSPIQLDLVGARAQASGVTATAIGDASTSTDGIILGGAITEDDLNMKVIPAVVGIIAGVITTHCPGAVAGNCMCDSTGTTVLNLFDTNKDCVVTAAEISSSSFAMSLLAPDVTINGVAALSLGVKAFAVGATYTVSGETM
jgi:hypothetical protein